MNRKRNKSSDEVTIEIKDSEDSKRNYWNLRDDDREYSYKENSSKGLEDEISIEFNLKEDRNLTERQKQTILNTLLQKPRKEAEKQEPGHTNYSNKWTVLLLILALSGIILAITALNTGC